MQTPALQMRVQESGLNSALGMHWHLQPPYLGRESFSASSMDAVLSISFHP
jgi:hypothetical protein